MRFGFIVCGTCAAMLILTPARAANGHDWARESIPQEWIEPLVPEDLPKLALPSYLNTVEVARAQLMAGRYKLALVTLRGAGADADSAQVALVKGEALATLGREGEALDVLSAPGVLDVAAIAVLRARVLAQAGRTGDALKLLREHLAANPDSIAGHYYLGALSERAGDLDSAKAAFGWFVEPPQNFLDKWQGSGGEAFSNAETLTLVGRAIDRHASLAGRYRDNAHLHDTLLNLFVRAYDVIDRTYWPARVAAAEYFLSHDDKENAGKELAAALEQNPNDPQALRLMGLLALEMFNFDMADRAIDTMRAVNRASAEAELLEARNLLQQRRPRDAEAPISRVLARDPSRLEALGLLAGAHALQLRDHEVRSVLARTDAIDPDDAIAAFETAEQLSAMRQYPRAAAMYRLAIERAPWWTAPRNGLGLLYTQSGDEDEAKVVLEAAHALDPFNLATTNYLRLLDDLAAFARSETEHFVILYDAGIDPIIPEYFGEYLERAYDEVCRDFDHEPAQKTLIEVFPTHDAFSVRTTGSPWIGTVGASTGRVIAMVAPRGGKNTMGAYNWARVLRHEFTHTVTLSATDNRIAHWMTEGLAVLEERSPIPWDWVPLLFHAVKKKELFTLEQLTWAFIRPRRPTDRTLGYAQSFWVCKYIQDTYGHEAILRMLAEFRAGGAQDDVFPKVLKVSVRDFEKGFFAWTEKQVSGWGYDEATSAQYDDLRERADALAKARQFEEALDLWKKAAALRPVDPLPHQRLAGLYLRLNRTQEAIEHLKRLHEVEIRDNRYAKRAARLYRDIAQFDDAIDMAREAVYVDPYDKDAHVLLSELYERTGDAKALDRERRVLALLAEWDKARQADLNVQ